MHKIEVRLKSHLPDPVGRGLVKDIQDMGINSVSDVRVVDVYWLDAFLAPEKVESVARTLLADTVTQDFRIDQNTAEEDAAKGYKVVEVAYNAGVTDPVRDSVMKAIRDMGILNVRAVAIAKRYLIRGEVSQVELDTLAGRLLMNPIVQHVVNEELNQFPENPQYTFEYIKVPFLNASLEDMEKARKQFGFTPQEFEVILDYFRKAGRDPIDVELETLAQTW